MELLFAFNIALLATHELDAIHQEEWRFFFRHFDDASAYRLFTILHLPLFALIFFYSELLEFQLLFDTFLIIHLGLHVWLRNHPLIQFRNNFSRMIIATAALGGLIHLLLLLSVNRS